jgi:hypothetical protein
MLKKQIAKNYKGEKNINFNISIKKNTSKLNNEENLNNYIKNYSKKYISKPINLEMTNFYPKNIITITPYFDNQNNFLNAGYFYDELTPSSDIIKNSYYIFELYDNYNSNNQVLLNQSLIRAVDKKTYNITEFTYNVLTIRRKTLIITPKLYFYNDKAISLPYNIFNIPRNYNKETCYLKISFFNAKNGTIYNFNNNIYNTNNTVGELENYLIIDLDYINYNWSINNYNTNIIDYGINSNIEATNNLNNKFNNSNKKEIKLNDDNINDNFIVNNLFKKIKI